MAIVYVISLEKSIENIPNKLQCTLSGWRSVWWYALMYAQPLSDISILFFANFQHLINLLITLYSQGYSLTHLILLPKCNSTKARNFKSELDYQKTKNLRSFQNKATQGGGKGEYRARTPKSIIHLISISFKFNSHEESPAREVNTYYLRVHIFMCSTEHIEIGLNWPKLDRTTRHRWKSSGSKRSNFQKDSYWFEVEQNCILLRESSTNPLNYCEWLLEIKFYLTERTIRITTQFPAFSSMFLLLFYFWW